MDKSITICARDVNGKHYTMVFPSGPYAYGALLSGCVSEEDAVLYVLVGGACIYSALGSTVSVTIEDMIGFFA